MVITSPAELLCLFYPNQFKEDPTVKDKPQERRHPAPEALPRDQSDGKQFLDQPLQRKPHWPLGLQLSGKKDMTCFIPEHLAVILSREAFEQLFSYTYSTSSEVCCLGTVKQQGERFRIERFYLVGQTGSSGHTELDQQALAALVEELLAQGKLEEARSLRCWAHSHPGMGLFWSKTDEDTCKRLVTDYLVSLVVSDGFAIRCRVDVGGPVPFAVDQVPVLVEVPVEASALEQYAVEVREKVKYEPVLLGLDDRADGRLGEALVPQYCDTCGWVHLQGHCPLSEETGDHQLGEGQGKQHDTDLLETGDDPTLFALDEESWF
jgi:hypothetical protein